MDTQRSSNGCTSHTVTLIAALIAATGAIIAAFITVGAIRIPEATASGISGNTTPTTNRISSTTRFSGLYDDFSQLNLDSSRWLINSESPTEDITVEPDNGALFLANKSGSSGQGFTLGFQNAAGSMYQSIQAEFMLSEKTNGQANITLTTNFANTNNWLEIGVNRLNNQPAIFAQTGSGNQIYQATASFDRWYIFKVEFSQQESLFRLYVDDKLVGTHKLDDNRDYQVFIQVWRGSPSTNVEGFIDNVYLEKP